MSKIGNAILLLTYLQNGKKYSITELAERLEVSERMIRNYKESLESVGFYIETIRGPYGGYILPKRINLPLPNWKEQDLNLLYKLKNKNLNQEEQEELTRVIEKMKICVATREKTVSMEEKSLYNLFSKAAKEHLKVKIIYESKLKGENERVIDPYELFFFHDGWGVTAFCEKKQDLRHFEFKRITEASILSEKF